MNRMSQSVAIRGIKLDICCWWFVLLDCCSTSLLMHVYIVDSVCSDKAIRVAVGLRLGSEICQPYYCICGALVDTRGSHALSSNRNPGRSWHHHFINDLIWRALSKAGFPSIKEPHGLLTSDNKRPDGLTLIPWRDGCCATWDVTVTDTVAPLT